MSSFRPNNNCRWTNKTYPRTKTFTSKDCDCWGLENIRTLRYRRDADWSERITALVNKELNHLNIDVAALSVIRLLDEDNIKEARSNYSFIWKEKIAKDPCTRGIGLTIRSKLVDEHNLVSRTSNGHLMTGRISLVQNRHLTLFSAYAPTLTSE